MSRGRTEVPAVDWGEARAQMLARVDDMLGSELPGFPHWADPTTGEWFCTEDGDWTGGAWPGMLWSAAAQTGDDRYRDAARAWCARTSERADRTTAFKGFGFFRSVALGPQAEESHAVGSAAASIDSLQATPLLLWAHGVTGEARYADIARAHTQRVLDLHMREDGSVVRSSELDPATGARPDPGRERGRR
ncbi:hypothetical protein [Pseudonocardia kunmingensis]|uniref:Glycosyl hydrolase family 88 n=1 Tax=Pseudonocardia kunmingensis TaxID=630975 RepID=A0A543DVN6_9PSEU|nr:hypothetical protein [Pseudonocardia kunmingensis]TQM13373.1 hypothetical protein FB558_0106 [Pseudonocardia kunmingensis]